jgi:hypothetical protein
MHGISEKTRNFDKSIADMMVKNVAPLDQAKLADQKTLDAKGVVVAREAAPNSLNLHTLTDEEWQEVKESDMPVLELWNKANIHSIETAYKHWGSKAESPAVEQSEQALLRSLPLLHNTTAQALYAALEAGSFKSNRQLHDEGVDVTDGIGNTNAYDREIGLDNYIFADFARPASNRVAAEVTVVLEPDAMQSKGSFLTEKDLQDCYDSEGRLDYRRYMSGALSVEDFYDVAAKSIRTKRSLREVASGAGMGSNYAPMSIEEFVAGSDSNPDQFGTPHFSTWEVKMSKASTSLIRKVIFTDKEQYEAFQSQYGDRIDCELADASALRVTKEPVKDIDANYREKLELFGTSARYEQESIVLRDQEYQRRNAEVMAGDQHPKEGYMLIAHPATDAADSAKYNPDWYNVSSRRYYDNAEDAAKAFRRRHEDIAEFHWKLRGSGDAERPEVYYSGNNVTLARVAYNSSGPAVIKELSKLE